LATVAGIAAGACLIAAGIAAGLPGRLAQGRQAIEILRQIESTHIHFLVLFTDLNFLDLRIYSLIEASVSAS